MSMIFKEKNVLNRKSLRSIFATFVAWVLLAVPLFAQTIKESNITLTLKNVTVATAFEAITNATNIKFFYDEEVVRNMPKVTLDAKNASVQELINDLSKQSKLYFTRSNNTFTVSRTATKMDSKQTKRLGGVVTDSSGEPVIGARVQIKGTSTGTVTDLDGRFSLNVAQGSTIQISYIGYQTIEQMVGQSEYLRIKMSDDVHSIDEVVVVGYGTAKKVNLTGAVGIASVKDIQSRPITSVSNGLQGLIPGVTVVNATGLPGQSTGTIRVRGIGTIGNSGPLVLIDGAEGNINLLNPEDIESVSVLKDAASASIYGSRSSNGVILVTTKNVSGKEIKPEINVSAYYGLQAPTRLPEMVSAIEYIQLDGEATRNVGKVANYSQSHIDRILDGSDPNYFNNTNWIGAIYNPTAPQYNISASVRGNGKGVGYLFSYNYLDQNGLTVGNTTKSSRHNIRLKVNTQIANFIDITANMGYVNRDYSTPSGGFASDGGAIYTAMRISPVIPVKFTDGGWGYGGGSANPVALLHDSGTNLFTSQEATGNFSAKVKLTKDWNVSSTYSYVQNNSLREILSKTINYMRPETDVIWYSTNPINKYENRDYTSIKQTLIAQTNYEKKIAKHSFSAIAGFSQEWYVEKNFTAARTNLVTEENPSLIYGSADTQSNGASAATWALRSGFGRLNYNYDERYLLEANMRYDLTSRFSKENRGGIFPSFSGAWRISEEGFMRGQRDIFDNLKLRASWGILGNQYVGSNDYPYMAIVGIVSVPRIGTAASDGYTQTSLPNPALQWETIKMTNVGLDMDLLNNRLGVSADYFIKNTEDILLVLTYPNILGMTPTEQNAGKVQNKGWEFTVRWNDKIGKDFSYGAAVNLADVKNKIIDFGGLAPSIGSTTIKRVGDPIDAFYGFVAERLAGVTDFEKYNSLTGRYENPKFPVLSDDASKVQPGDIILSDISGPDGVPDGILDATYDRKVIGSSIPRYTYSFLGNAAWKGFDFNFTIQGVGKCDGYLQGAGRHAFTDQSTYPQKLHLERWTFDNPNPHAVYPRLTFVETYNQRFSSYWLENASYLRLKNVQLGYSFPKSWLKPIHAEKLRFYFSADNLLTLTNFFYAYDPETPVSNGGYYPQVKTFVFGFNLTLK